MAREFIIEELHFAPVKVLEEEQGAGTGTLRFEAVVSEADFLNRNRRTYPEAVLFPAFEAYKAQLADNLGQPGLVDHPGMFDGASVSDIGIKWEDFWFEGKKVIGRGSVVLTHRGQDLAAVMKAGIPVAFSTRGYGEQEEFDAPDGRKARRMLPGYELETVDAVVDPSVFHARVRRVSQEENERMEEQLKELQAQLEALQAELAAANEKLAGYESASESHASVVEGLNATVESLTRENEELKAKVAELAGELAKSAAEAAENALTVKLAELTEGHRFAPTIIAEARELGVTLENAEKVISRLKALVEAAGAAANEAAPRGELADEEEGTEQTEEPEAPVYTREQLEDLYAGRLISKSKYEAELAKLG